MADSDISADLEKRIAELQAELKNISRTLTDGGYDIYDDAKVEARKAASVARRKASEFADEAQAEVTAVARTARENPAITSVLLTGVALAGFAIGLVVGASNQSHNHHRYW